MSSWNPNKNSSSMAGDKKCTNHVCSIFQLVRAYTSVLCCVLCVCVARGRERERERETQTQSSDLSDQIYSFPMSITPTECRPDIVVCDNKEAMLLIELTVPFETNLKQECRQRSYTSLITVQVRARGYLDQESLHNLYQMLGVRVQSETKRKFEP